MSTPQPGVRPRVAVALTTVGFVAVVIAGYGLLSLLLEQEVIATPGLGALPGALALAAATVAYVVTVGLALRLPRPHYRATATTVVAVLIADLLGLWLGAIISGVDAARATAAAASFVLSWFSVMLAAAAFVSAWCAVALVRTRASRPRWPWERDEDE